MKRRNRYGAHLLSYVCLYIPASKYHNAPDYIVHMPAEIFFDNTLPAYIDMHTHQHNPDLGVLAVVNKYAQFDQLETARRYSLGLHPWYLEQATTQLEQLGAHISKPQVLALGECGLDRLCKTDMGLQKEVFARQIRLANEQRKPLVIHCVKAFPEALSMLQDAAVPVVFHGFNNKAAQAEAVLKAGHSLSFGAALLRPGAIAAQVLAFVPADRFLLETDDKSNLDIREIYRAASFIRKTGEDVIILQLQKNFQKVVNT